MYEKIRNFFSSPVFIVIMVALLCFYLYSLGKNSARSDIDLGRIPSASEQLGRAVKNQSELTGKSEQVKKSVENISGEVAPIRESVGESANTLQGLADENERAGELIAECQRVLGDARKRAEKRETKN